MAEKIKKGDYIEIIFVGRDNSTGNIFDLNDEEIAKKEEIYNPKHEYKPTIICVGKRDVVTGLDEVFEGKEIGQKFTINIPCEKGFGKKNSKLFQLVSASKFKQKPYPGMQVDVNGKIATVKTVSGGRIMLDFNHPLAGKELKYDVTIKRKINDDKEKISSFMKLYLNMDPKIEIKEGVAKIDLEVPPKFQEEIKKQIKERVPTIKKIEFKELSEKKSEKKE